MAEGRIARDGTAPPGPPPPSPGAGIRVFQRLLLLLLAGAICLDLALLGLGFIGEESFPRLAWGGGLLLAACLAWEVVVASGRGGRQRAYGWVAFPVAFGCALASVPFLALSAFPALEGWIFRVEAYTSPDGRVLSISFPIEVVEGEPNLRIDGLPVAERDRPAPPGACRWTTPRTLEVDWRGIPGTRPGSVPRTVEVNTVPDLDRLHYATGGEIPAQTVQIAARDNALPR